MLLPMLSIIVNPPTVLVQGFGSPAVTGTLGSPGGAMRPPTLPPSVERASPGRHSDDRDSGPNGEFCPLISLPSQVLSYSVSLTTASFGNKFCPPGCGKVVDCLAACTEGVVLLFYHSSTCMFPWG